MKETMNLSVNADLFINPSASCRIDDFWFSKEKKEAMLNKLIIDDVHWYEEGDYLFKICITADNEAFKADNAQCHVSRVITESGKVIDLYPNELPDVFPVKPFLCRKEGDIVPVTFPIEREDVTINLTMNLRLAQTEYKYKYFGKFEEVLRKI